MVARISYGIGRLFFMLVVVKAFKIRVLEMERRCKRGMEVSVNICYQEITMMILVVEMSAIDGRPTCSVYFFFEGKSRERREADFHQCEKKVALET